jgi:hypothetical protein
MSGVLEATQPAGTQNKSPTSSSGKPGRSDWFAAAILVALVCLFFYKTVFLGQSVSKPGLLYSVDAIFNPALKQHMLPFLNDPSGYLLFFPVGNFAEKWFRSGVVPLWNPLDGCGYPLIGDIQSHLFSAVHLLSFYGSPRGYDLLIVWQSVIAAVATYCLARCFGLSAAASCLAALGFALSPRVLKVADLANGECLYPVLALAFACLARTPTATRAAFVGVLCAVCVATMHPEPCFFAITFGALLFLTMAAIEPGESGSPVQHRLLHAFKLLSLAATVAICLSAPVLLPFFEFFGNASFYKAVHATRVVVTAASHAGYSLLDYLRGLITGRADDGLFMGTVAALFLLPGLVYQTRRTAAIALVWLIAVAVSMPVGWLAELLALKPLSYVALRYCLPEVVLFGALVAAAGFHSILDQSRQSRQQKWPVLLCSIILVSAALAVFTWQKLGGDVLAPVGLRGIIAEILRSRQLLTIVVVAASALPLVLVRDRLGALAYVMVPAALVGLNFLSQATICKNVLPVCPRFDLAGPQPVKFLQERQGRVAATGDHFLLPNVNMFYGLEDCRSYNPLNLKRYASFFDRHGMTLGSGFTLTLPNRLDHLIDLASVKHIVTREAITSVDDSERLPGCYSLTPASEGRIALGLRLKRARLYYDAVNSQINGLLQWRVHDYASSRYALQYFVLDSSGRELWSSQRKLISAAGAAGHLLEQPLALPIPLSVAPGSAIDVCFSVYDSWTSSTVKPDGLTLTLTGPHVRLASVRTADAATSSLYPSRSSSAGQGTGRHFILVEEIPDNCRIYENRRALPAAYIAGTGIFVESAEESLKRVGDLTFDPRKEVILESPEPAGAKHVLSGSPSVAGEAGAHRPGPAAVELQSRGRRSEPSESVHVERPNPNSVVVDTTSYADGFLVLTDSYYPGWQATVDGQDVEILKANHLFRAVRLPAGTHRVEFNYRPGSFLVGLGLAAIGVVIVLVVLWRRSHPGRPYGKHRDRETL